MPGKACERPCDAGEPMRVDVVNSVVINRPVAEISQYVTDPDNAPLW